MPTPAQASAELAQVAKVLRRLGDRELKSRLAAGIRKGGQVALEDARTSAESTLPKRGGLAGLVSGQKLGVRTRLSGSFGSGRLQTTGAVSHGEQADSGRLRHPVFGSADRWAEQAVTPGWWTQPMEDNAPKYRAEIDAVIGQVVREAEARV